MYRLQGQIAAMEGNNIMEDTKETLIVWCEDTDEWGITNGQSNKTWDRFPNRYVPIMKAVESVHRKGNKATFLLGRGASRTFNLDGTETEIKGW